MEIINLLDFTDRIELRNWLKANHNQAKSCWVITSRSKQPTYKCIPYIEVVEEALCFGWIDSTIKKLPDGRLVQRLSPRRQAFERAYSYEIVPKGSLMEEIIRKHDKELRPDLYK